MICLSRDLGPRERDSSNRKHNNDFIELEVGLPAKPPYVMNKQAKEEVTVLTRMIDLDYQEEIRLLKWR